MNEEQFEKINEILEEVWGSEIVSRKTYTVEELIINHRKALLEEELKDYLSEITRIIDALRAYEGHGYVVMDAEDISMGGQLFQCYVIIRNNEYLGIVQTL